MAIFAVVPVKKLVDSKRRLSTVFTPRERRMLTLAMLEDVLNALNVSVVDDVVVVGEDSEVKCITENYGATYFELKDANLNPSIEEAQLLCLKKGATALLVLPADIPLVNAKEINRIIQLAESGSAAVALSQSQNGGTNALYQNPPKLIPACFGPGSFLNHIREAYRRGVSVRLHFSPQLAADIDSAEDLKSLFENENSTVCKRVLQQIMDENSRARKFFVSSQI